MNSILERIFAVKRLEVEAEQRKVPPDELMAVVAAAPAPRPMMAALRARRPAIIAEIKRASPSKGDILPSLDPAAVAAAYAAAGAAAVSVLTDVHFRGSLADLKRARAAIDLPLLRKDFIFDRYQLLEARAAGADCILLIAAMLEQEEMRSLASAAQELGMASLIEVHDEREFRIAREIGAELIGINSRDLHSFRTDMAVTERLIAGYNGKALIVAESGIETPADLERLDQAGAHAFLIGETLLRGGDPCGRLAELINSFAGARRQVQN